MSFGQQRLWFIDQLQSGQGVFNSQVCVWLTGPLDVKALERSLAAIVGRHDVLRASFPAKNGQPVQRVARALSIPLPVVDLRELPDARTTEVNRLISEEMHRPFDLSRGPLVRASLTRVDVADHVLLLTIHHIVFDGWSRAVLIRELSAFYTSFVRGEPASLPPLPLQYTDYTQRETQQGDLFDRHFAFWKKRLGGDLPMLELPTDHPRPPVVDFRGGQHVRRLPRSLTDALEALSRRQGVTPFMTFLAAFKILLSRLTGVEDVLVVSPIAGRTDVEPEGLIGFFVKTLILRTDLSGNPAFQELLSRVRTVTLDALDHQDVPFQTLVDTLHAERFLNRNPVCDVAINFLNTPDLDVEMHGIAARILEPLEKLSEFSLMMNVSKREGALEVQMVYQRALFSAERIALIMNQFEYLLEQIVAASERPIRAYSLVAPASQRLLPDPSAAIPEPSYEPVTVTFFSQAARATSATAVSQGERIWTYGELAQRASELARALTACGHKPGDVVAVIGAPSFGVVVSMIAVLASGGVLLAIEPDLPVERKRLMLREATAKRLVHVESADADDEVREFASCMVIRIDGCTGRPFDAELGAPQLSPQEERSSTALYEPRLDDPAYIFFTSGTSGVPKGVLGCHKSLAHFLAWQREQFIVVPQDRCAQLTSLSFDVVLRDVLLPLVSGATLCLPEARWRSGHDVLSWLDRERITLLHTVPSLVSSWLEQSGDVALRSLRYIFFAGEPLTERLVRRWRDTFPASAEIVNLYGTTEATLSQCFFVVPANPLPGIQPVGWPLPQTQALVLNRDRQLCGIGERGEIAIRTPFLTLGYVNAPDETRLRFIRNPFRDDDRDLVYLTGDEGRYRPDGALETLGRLDDQVKVHGVRVELHEVNLQLLQHPSVKASCVLTRKNEYGEPSIVAYVVPSAPDAFNARQLRAFLSRWLPSAMVPASFVVLPELPLTPSGKIDRSALHAGPSFRHEPAHKPILASDEPATRLSDADRHRLLIEWNKTAAAYPDHLCLHQLVEAQRDRTPDAIAVVCGREEISYEALNARANQLARLLRKRGVAPDVLVGLCLERSIEMVVGLLGILKAGGAYVPLDPSYPHDRLRFMLEDAAVRVVVTEARLAESLRALAVELVCLDTDGELFAAEHIDNLESGTTPDNLAYVMYTSGSTGRPKGVMIAHRAVCNYVQWAQTTFPLTAEDRVLQRTPFSFDPSVWEFYGPLIAGAVLIMAPPGAQFDPAQLVKTIDTSRVTILQLVPSLLLLLLEESDLSRCDSLRRVLCSGEALSYEVQERFFARLDASLHNQYGPTETCINSACWTCQREGDQGAVPIGRPIANTQMYVLDTSLQPVPVGMEGELHIGGVGLARGYVNRPDLTAERFIPHPFSVAPGARLYRTGDRVRYLRDGNLVFLGRVDHQVKVHGVRIEPGEIESVLRRHPGVREAVVIAREDSPGDRRLVAYLVPGQQAAPTNGELRRFLSGTLPEPLVPSTFVWLDAFPLSASGKIDRPRLPAPALGRPNLPDVFVAPRTAIEEAMARIWSEVLRVDPIGIHDDFFDLGGHSLLATQVISRMNDTFERKVPLRWLFEMATIGELAKAIEGSEPDRGDASRPTTRHAPRATLREKRESSPEEATND